MDSNKEVDFRKMVQTISDMSTPITRYLVPDVNEILTIWSLRVIEHIIYDMEKTEVSLSDFILQSGEAYNETVGKCFIEAERTHGPLGERKMMRFSEMFASLLLEKWKTESLNYDDESEKLISAYTKRASSSQMAEENKYKKNEGHLFVDLGRVPKDYSEALTSVNAYVSWPLLLDLLDDSIDLKKDPYFYRLVSSCFELIQLQSLIYDNESDRERRFILWINKHLSYFGLPHLCTQTNNSVALINYECVCSLKDENEDWIHPRSKEPRNDLPKLKNILLLSEAKRSANSNLIFGHSGFYIFSLYRKLSHKGSNLPVLFIHVDGPCLRFGAAVRNADAPFAVEVTELESFTLTKRIVSLSQVESLALYLFKFFRILRSTVDEIKKKRTQNDKYSIFPSIPGTGPYSRFCPRWQFQDVDDQLWHVKYISIIQPPNLLKSIFKASISLPNGLESREVIVRIQEHYGSLFDRQLSKENSPRLCPRLLASLNYYEGSDKLKYIVTERMGDKWKPLFHVLLDGRLQSRGLFRIVNKNLLCLKKWLQMNPNIHHGDIRTGNILVNTSDADDETPSEKSVTKRERKTPLGEIRLIDAEFGSEVETQTPRYPYLLNSNLFEEFGCWTREEFDRLPGSELTLEQDIKMLNYVISRVVQTPNFNADDSSDSSGDSRRLKTPRKDY